MGMFDAFGRFMGKLVDGDLSGAAEVLQEDQGSVVGRTCKGCQEKTHKEGDPPCQARDGDFVCMGHGQEGTCVMGRKG